MSGMTIVERLRMSASKDLHEDWYKRECREAADRIELLEAALRVIMEDMDDDSLTEDIRRIAAQALQ